MVTAAQVVDHLLSRRAIGQKIATGQFTLAAGAITSPYYFAAENWGPNHLVQKEAGFWRPSNATGLADDFRQAQALAPASGAVTVRTYTDSTAGVEDIYELDHRIHPEQIIEALNKGLRDVYFQNEDVLSVLKDPGFQASGVSDWSTTNATLSKVVTAAGVFPTFVRAGSVDVTNSNGNIFQLVPVTPGETLYVTALVMRQDSGTVSLVAEDNTNLVDIATVEISSGSNWRYLRLTAEVPSTCFSVAVRLRGSTSNADFSVQGVWVTRAHGLIMPIHSLWVANDFHIPVISYLNLKFGDEEDILDPFAVEKKIVPREAYDFINTGPSPNPSAIQWHRPDYLRYPLMIQGRRAHADFEGPVTRVLTEVLTYDLDLGEAATARRLFSDARVDLADRVQRLQQAEFDFDALANQSRNNGPARKRTFAFMGLSP